MKKPPNHKGSANITSLFFSRVYENGSFGGLFINSVGDIFACSTITSLPSYANIRKDSFEKICELSNLAKELSNIDSLEPCKDCHLKYICGGGCRIKEFKEFTENSDYRNLHISSKICTDKEKEYFYRLMIETNKDLFQ